jgi:hypothetical protein
MFGVHVIYNFSHGVRLSPLGTPATVWPLVLASDDRWWWLWSSRWNEKWQGKPKYSEKTCPISTLSTTNPTWLDPCSRYRCGGWRGQVAERNGGLFTTHAPSAAAGIHCSVSPCVCWRNRTGCSGWCLPLESIVAQQRDETTNTGRTISPNFVLPVWVSTCHLNRRQLNSRLCSLLLCMTV